MEYVKSRLLMYSVIVVGWCILANMIVNSPIPKTTHAPQNTNQPPACVHGSLHHYALTSAKLNAVHERECGEVPALDKYAPLEYSSENKKSSHTIQAVPVLLEEIGVE